MLLESNELDIEAMGKLAKGEALALRVRQFIGNDIAQKLGDKILFQGFDKYANAPSIGRIGMAFYEAENQPPRIADYFESAYENIDELRKRCFPYFSPIDLLRCKLDETWLPGAQLETLYGRKMYVGLSRVIKPGVRFLAHHDIFAKDAPDSFKARSLQTQIAANVYLTMPSEGGAVQIWDRELTPEEFDGMRGDSYGIDPEILGDPDLEICPEPGDLVLFNSRRMHAVTPGSDDLRLSLSCFIGYRGDASPLSFWS
ncbi:2OG-Fe(II) oxygenase [Marinobacterium sp. D7]|nr:2OG-Fe(II) oxygenase [Marinobacterium ramblicola]